MDHVRLSQGYVDEVVSQSTLNEADLAENYYDFLMEHYPGFDQTDVCQECNSLRNDDGKFSEVTYIVNELLDNFFNQIAPVGCFFGSHLGSGSLIGFWSVLNYDLALSEFDEAKKLPYKHGGYDVCSKNDNFTSMLSKLDLFFDRHYSDDEYEYSELHSFLDDFKYNQNSELSDYDKKHGQIVFSFIVNSIMPIIAPKGFTWRYNSYKGLYGLYPELPKYTVAPGSLEESKTTQLIYSSSVYEKLVYLIENKQGTLLTRHENKNPDRLNDLCIDTMTNPHFVPFYLTLELARWNEGSEARSYITENDKLTNWIIESMFYNKFKDGIDKALGCQDITRLWNSITGQYDASIDGIETDDVWGLRETCNVCENIDDLESNEWYDRDCVCCTYDDLNNVWIVGVFSFYKNLEKVGAMIYETDSLYLYLQTDYGGNYYDILLRKAWLLDNWFAIRYEIMGDN